MNNQMDDFASPNIGKLKGLLTYFNNYISYKVEISVCMLVCLIVTNEPLDQFASDWENHRNVDFYRGNPGKLGSQDSICRIKFKLICILSKDCYDLYITIHEFQLFSI